MVVDLLEIIVKVRDMASKKLKDINNKLDEGMQKMGKMRIAMMSIGLSFLFTGMAIKRFFGSALRSIWNTYKEVIDVNDKFFKATQRLSAAWEFFKFSLIDALGQSPMFMMLIEAVIQLVNWFGRLSPEMKTVIAWIVILGLVFGTLMMIGGQMMLFFIGMWILAMIIPLGLVIFGLLLIIAVVLILYYVWSSNMTLINKILLTIAVVVFLIIALLILGVAAWMLWAIAIIAIIVLIIIFWKRIKLFMMDTRIGLRKMANSIGEFFFGIINRIIDGINVVRRALGRGEISNITFTGYNIEKLEAERDAYAAEGEGGPGMKEQLMEKSGLGGLDKDALKDALKDAVKDGISESDALIVPSPMQ